MGKKPTNLHCQTCHRKRQASGNSYRGLDPELVKMVRHIAAKSIGKAGLKEHDLPDIEQELMLAALNGMRHYDQARSTHRAFVKVLLKTIIKRIFRDRHSASGRTCCNQESLNQELELDDETVEIIEQVNADGLLEQPNSQSAMQTFHDLSMTLDIASATAGLSDDLQQLCRELQKHSIAEAAQSLNLSQRKIYQDIQTIRIYFQTFFIPQPLSPVKIACDLDKKK